MDKTEDHDSPIFALKYLPDAAFIVGADGSIIASNDAANRLYAGGDGVNGEVKLTGILKFWMNERDALSLLDLCMAEGFWRGDVMHRLPSGHTIQVDCSFERVETPSGKSILAIFRDVSERIRMLEAEKKRSDFFRQLLDNSSDVIIRIGQDGKLEYCSPSVTAFGGYDPEEEIGQSIEKYFADPEGIGKAMALIREVIEKKSSATFEFLYKPKSGGPFFVEVTGKPIWQNGNLMAIQCNMRDISQRKKSEEEIRQFKTIADNANYGIGIADFDNRLIYINEYFARIHGYNPEEIIGKSLSIFHSPEQYEEARQINRVFSKEGGYSALEVWHQHKDGSTFPMLMTGVVIKDDEGEPQFLAATAIDMTDMKRADEERAMLVEKLREAQKMEAIGRLAGGIAHEFNNLLTGISGNVSLTLLDCAPQDEHYESLMDIAAAAERAADLTRKLLAFSRKQIIQPQIFSLHEMIKKLEGKITDNLGNGIKLKLDLAAKADTIRADRGQIEQIIFSLVLNAKDAMPDGGLCIIETLQVELDAKFCRNHSNLSPGKHLMLVVGDTGKGIDPEMQKHIFEPFFTTKPIWQGSGLGLSSVYGAVTQNNASIQVQSEIGFGSTFRIYFPLHSEDEFKARTDGRNMDLPGGCETVLFVEDEPVLLNMGVKILERLGYNVISAQDGMEGFELGRSMEIPIDLLVTDAIMPQMNGGELAERLRVLYPSIKVLFMSGYADDVVSHHGMLNNKAQFLAKPYTPHLLASKVRLILDNR